MLLREPPPQIMRVSDVTPAAASEFGDTGALLSSLGDAGICKWMSTSSLGRDGFISTRLSGLGLGGIGGRSPS